MKKTFVLTLLFIFCHLCYANPKLEILESYTVELPEISGMCWRKNPETKRNELVLVSDNIHKLFFIDWDNRQKNFRPTFFDLTTIDKQIASDKSEWESVYSDETGRLFILRENPSRILIISADLKKIEADIELKVPEKLAKEIQWNQEINALGEGLIALKNGHFLIIKEKNPLKIMEFSPGGAKAEGYQAKLHLEHSGTFPLPKDLKNYFEATATWGLTPEDQKTVTDASGINIDGKGDLILLSDESNRLIHLGNSLKEGEKLKFAKTWILPETIKQPEGMVIDSQNRPIIAIDQKKKFKTPNLFVLSELK